MTVLPIVERELRVRARGRAVYWTRFAVALAGILVCLPQVMWSAPVWAPATLGRSLFNGLVSGAFLLSCGACLLTADVISSERREGTLGLLLLTRIRPFDVLVGKLGSAGLTSVCALVACLPMLMIPILAGGVMGGEVFRKGLALMDTLFLALAAGLWASARGHEWLKTARTALLLVATVVLIPVLFGLVFGRAGVAATGVGLLSPLGTILAAGAAAYQGSAPNYWISLLLVQAMGWALVVGAGVRLRSGWREERGEILTPAPMTAEETEREAAIPSRIPLGDDANPVAWLLQRQRGIQALLWAGALISLSDQGLFTIGIRFISPGSYGSVAYPVSLAITVLGDALFAWAASRFFVEARRTGELELLLTTPFGAREIVTTQWKVLVHRLRWPMVVLLAPTLLRAIFALATMSTSSTFGPGGSYGLHYTISALIGCVDTFFGMGALCWVALWFGLKAGGQARTIVWTVSLVRGLPFLATIVCTVLYSALAQSTRGRNSLPLWIVLWLPQAVTLVLYLGLIGLARQRLLGELAGAEPMRFDLRQSISSATRDAVSAFRKARHWTPS